MAQAPGRNVSVANITVNIQKICDAGKFNIQNVSVERKKRGLKNGHVP
jgi:hypothetical protein